MVPSCNFHDKSLLGNIPGFGKAEDAAAVISVAEFVEDSLNFRYSPSCAKFSWQIINTIKEYYVGQMLRMVHLWKFMRLQKISFYASFLVLILAVITFGKIMKGIDVFTMTEKLNWLVPSGIGVLFIFSQWVLKKYKKATDSANDILKELED